MEDIIFGLLIALSLFLFVLLTSGFNDQIAHRIQVNKARSKWKRELPTDFNEPPK